MREQHDEADKIAAEIIAIVDSFRDDYDAIPIARLIGKLNALLRVHLAYEDLVLYPLLKASGHGAAAELAHCFCDETNQLAQDFEDFARRWSGPTVIAAMFDHFREEATALLARLAARIERENDQLFPLARQVLLERAAARRRSVTALSGNDVRAA